ncbi:flagellar biosynthesis protein FlhB [Ruminococcaceae bacterium OttesenSCG-928-O06]|nr:flagellar biosynthesis protein FlhB [Ruminococcaceae bacterium OttesenSCG-928-O06]
MGGGEKTEQATPKRKRDERRKGNVFKSQEIVTLAGLLGVIFTLQALGTLIINTLTEGITSFWYQAANVSYLTVASLREHFVRGAAMFAVAALPALLVAGLVAIILTFAQTRGLFSGEKLKPKFGNLSPLKGFKRMFSVRGLVELLKSLLKIIILGVVIYNQYTARLPQLPRLMEMEFPQVLLYTADFMMDVVTSVAVIFAFLAGADYMYQRWQYEKDLRMTKQEIKEEYKQTEGDPKVKGKIRERQRAMSMGRMMQNVPEADVIIRNPTHYAVAIRYEASENRAPVVLAKGADLVALRIIKTGEEHGVTITENRPLARSLYENVPLDREIPEEYFQAVAEILAFVYETSMRHKLPKNPPS